MLGTAINLVIDLHRRILLIVGQPCRNSYNFRRLWVIVIDIFNDRRNGIQIQLGFNGIHPCGDVRFYPIFYMGSQSFGIGTVKIVKVPAIIQRTVNIVFGRGINF